MKQEALTRNFRAHGARKSYMYMYTTAIVVVSFKVKTICQTLPETTVMLEHRAVCTRFTQKTLCELDYRGKQSIYERM